MNNSTKVLPSNPAMPNGSPSRSADLYWIPAVKATSIKACRYLKNIITEKPVNDLPLPAAPIEDVPAWHKCMTEALASSRDRLRFDIYSGYHFKGREDGEEYLAAFTEWATAFCYMGGLSDPLTWRDKNGVLLSEGGGPDGASGAPSRQAVEQDARMMDILDKARRAYYR